MSTRTDTEKSMTDVSAYRAWSATDIARFPKSTSTGYDEPDTRRWKCLAKALRLVRLSIGSHLHCSRLTTEPWLTVPCVLLVLPDHLELNPSQTQPLHRFLDKRIRPHTWFSRQVDLTAAVRPYYQGERGRTLHRPRLLHPSWLAEVLHSTDSSRGCAPVSRPDPSVS